MDDPRPGPVTIKETAPGLLPRQETDVRAKVGITLELDGLRAVAAWLVFLIHYISLAQQFLAEPQWISRSAAIAKVGYLGVELFFVLSGYLVYGIVADGRTSPGKFVSRRLTKILPTFWLILLLYVITGLLIPEFRKISLPADWLVLLGNIFLLPGVYSVPAIVTVSWSLSYEIHFYLALFLLLVFRVIRVTTRRQRIIAMCTFALLLGYGAPLLGLNSIGQFVLFVPGMLAWEIVAARIDAPKPTNPFAIVAFLFLLVGLVLRSTANYPGIGATAEMQIGGPLLSVVLIGIPTCVVIFRTALGDSSSRKILGNSVVIAGGRVSYSFYLTHSVTLHGIVIALRVLRVAELSPWMVFVGFVPSLMIAHFVAKVVFENVEEPAMRMKFARRAVPQPT